MGDAHGRSTAETDSPSPPRISRLQRAVEQRVANPLFCALLRSRLHWLVSNWLVLVSYAGRQSSQRYTFPVAYSRWNGTVVVVTPSAESTWWRNFREPRRCTVWLRGVARAATGAVVAGDERESLVAAYFEDNRAIARLLGGGHVDPSDPEEFREAKQDLTLVRFTLDRERRADSET